MHLRLLYLIYFLPFLAYGQKCVFGTPAGNIIYSGLDNTIYISVSGYHCNEFVVTTDNGKITKSTNDSCTYKLTPSKIGVANISVISKRIKNKLIQKAGFRVKEIPSPVAQIAGRSGGEIQMSIFQAQLGITAALTEGSFEARFAVKGYTIIITRDTAVIFIKKFEGPRFTNEVKKALDNLKINDEVIFSGMTCVGADSKVRYLVPIGFQLVE